MVIDTRPQNYVLDENGKVLAEWPMASGGTPKPNVLPIGS